MSSPRPSAPQEIVNGIADARLVVVPQSGHSTPLEQPAFVTRELVEFLER